MSFTVYIVIGTAFSIWMLIDAIRRRAEPYWFVLLILFSPLASVIYFFVVKLKDYRQPAAQSTDVVEQAARTGGLAQGFGLRLKRRLDQADTLERREAYPDAIPIYESVLKQDETNKQALHGLARCYMGIGEYEQAQDLLMKLLEQDRKYRDYSAVLDYAEALALGERHRDALELLQGLVSVSPRPNHRVALAHYAMKAQDLAVARRELELLLEEHGQSPENEQKKHARWAERAEEMLNKLEASLN